MRARTQQLSAIQQYMLLRGRKDVRGSGRVHLGFLRWEFEAQPSPTSRQYQLLLEYRVGSAPQVTVRFPDLLDLSGGRRLPHVYSQCPTQLCLFLPSSNEWHPRMMLIETVIPWSFLWLFYFEEWLVSDVWSGGGVHAEATR